MILLFCRRCDTRFEAVTAFPTICPACGLAPARWTTFRPVTQPLTPFHNSETDRVFLTSYKISSED